MQEELKLAVDAWEQEVEAHKELGNPQQRGQSLQKIACQHNAHHITLLRRNKGVKPSKIAHVYQQLLHFLEKQAFVA